MAGEWLGKGWSMHARGVCSCGGRYGCEKMLYSSRNVAYNIVANVAYYKPFESPYLTDFWCVKMIRRPSNARAKTQLTTCPHAYKTRVSCWNLTESIDLSHFTKTPLTSTQKALLIVQFVMSLSEPSVHSFHQQISSRLAHCLICAVCWMVCARFFLAY